MAFLDNSGDIILDATLTDEGRRRLARADGSFKITKFSLADDEIDYSKYNKNHASGSPYYDLEILQTPVLEAFTNSSTQLKSKLLTYLDNTLFYLPEIEINDLDNSSKRMDAVNTYGIACTKTSRDKFTTVQGVIDGFEPKSGKSFIHLDQGLDTEAITPDERIPADQRETQYILSIDNRFGHIVDMNGNSAAASFVDADDVAHYYFTLNTNNNYVTINTNEELSHATEVIRGPRGTTLKFKIRSSLNLRQSNYLFDQVGSTGTLNDKDGNSTAIRFIDTQVKVTGGTTGFMINIPVRFIKTSAE